MPRQHDVFSHHEDVQCHRRQRAIGRPRGPVQPCRARQVPFLQDRYGRPRSEIGGRYELRIMEHRVYRSRRHVTAREVPDADVKQSLAQPGHQRFRPRRDDDRQPVA